MTKIPITEKHSCPECCQRLGFMRGQLEFYRLSLEGNELQEEAYLIICDLIKGVGLSR